MNTEGQQPLIEELESRIIRLKAREFELSKETQSVHDELLLTISKVQGLRELQNTKKP